ncbi:MAG: T9SS type A sorting domain-containing protein [Ignavibacteriaceae bacterium]|nr:T9SS type A sorting domain-containing protein [Ignavibacteriaceae bacterium]
MPRVDYVGVHFSNKDIGWAVGGLGALIKTTDGGANWKTIQTNITVPILKIRSINGQTVIASGYSGLILRSTDGGEIFTQVESGLGAGFDLWGLEIVNDTLGWACGATALLKTTDGGESWQIINIPGYTGNLWWIDFMNENYGFVAADGKVLKTTDGGNNWEIIQAGDDRPLYCINIIDSSHIAAAGYGGTNYSAKNIYSNDGGYTWIHGGNLTTEEVNCIKYVSADTGYLVMSNVSAWKTTNRGTEWTTIQGISDTYELQILENINEIIGYSAGTGLKISKTENGYENWERLIMNDNFSDVCFVSEEKGFALGNYNVLYKTTDGGINWTAKGVLGSCITFIDSLKGFIGSSGAIWKTTDGGNNWYITNGANGASKIFIKNETTGWAIRDNIIYKTTDSGDNWFTQFTAPTSVRFTSIYFVDSLYGWTANLGGRPYKTTNGGIEWVQQTNLDLWITNDIYFENYTKGWIIDKTSWSALKKTIDGGLNWIKIPDVLNPFKFHFFPDSNHWLISGTPQKYITEDGGFSWIDITSDIPSIFTSFRSVTNKLGFAAGGLGLLLRYDDTAYVPVELNSFTAVAVGNNILLSWSTSSELNNSAFQIERSTDKTNWRTIGFIEGNNTTIELNNYSFIDSLFKNNSQKLFYRLKQIDFTGTFKYSNTIKVEIGIPSKFFLSQNYPNPFNPITQIKYSIKENGLVSIRVFDVLGKEVAILIKEERPAGEHEVNFDGSNLSSGIYFYTITANDFHQTKKMLLIK